METRTLNIETDLSKQQKRIARLLAWGYTQKEIGNRLFISTLTVGTHIKNIYRNLQIRKETDLCRCWIFYEYAIADNPIKKILAFFFLALMISTLFTENRNVRVFRSAPLRKVENTAKVSRTRRYENVFDLKLSLT